MGFIVMVARDVGPTRALERVSRLATEAFKGSICILGDGKPLPNGAEEITGFVRGAEVLLCGMSSSPELAREELIACEAAVKNGVPLALFSDTFRTWARPWFESYREATSVLFVINKEEADEAREFFPNAKIVASGNPAWEDFFFPKYSRGSVREKLAVGDMDSIILVPGSKNLVVNMLLFGGAVEAGIMLSKAYGSVFISLHPGDKNPPELYKDIAEFSPILVKFVPNEILSASDMIPGVDVVVESASTIGVEAACQRVPVVEYLTYAGLENLARQTGSTEYEPCRLKIAEPVLLGVQELSETLDMFLCPGGSVLGERMRER